MKEVKIYKIDGITLTYKMTQEAIDKMLHCFEEQELLVIESEGKEIYMKCYNVDRIEIDQVNKYPSIALEIDGKELGHIAPAKKIGYTELTI